MRIAVGILFLIAGIVYPMAAMFWFNQRMGRPPILLPRHVGRVLAFNGVFPVTLITLGIGLLSARLGASLTFRVVIVVSAIASIVLFAMLWREWTVIRGERGDHGRGAKSAGV